jgi:hypothetical protein
MDRVLVCCEDMFFRVNIEAAIRAAGLRPVPANQPAELEAALSPTDAVVGAASAPGPGGARLRAAVVDLAARSGGALEVIARVAAAQPGIAILAFGPHGERESLAAARRAGAIAVPRSRFVREYPAFMQKVALGIPPEVSEEEPAGEGPGE